MRLRRLWSERTFPADLPSLSVTNVSEIDFDVVAVMFVNDVWFTEFPTLLNWDQGMQLCDFVAWDEQDKFLNCAAKFDTYCMKPWWRILRNLYVATNEFIGGETRHFGIDLIKEVHACVMKGDTEPGVFRTVNVRPWCSSTVYALPDGIPDKLGKLVDFVNETPTSSTQEKIALACLFFSEFLLIHPFRDGNGRTARILLSCLLRDVCAVPYVLNMSRREIFLNVLEKRGICKHRFPDALTEFIFTRIDQTYSDMLFLFPDAFSNE